MLKYKLPKNKHLPSKAVDQCVGITEEDEPVDSGSRESTATCSSNKHSQLPKKLKPLAVPLKTNMQLVAEIEERIERETISKLHGLSHVQVSYLNSMFQSHQQGIATLSNILNRNKLPPILIKEYFELENNENEKQKIQTMHITGSDASLYGKRRSYSNYDSNSSFDIYSRRRSSTSNFTSNSSINTEEYGSNLGSRRSSTRRDSVEENDSAFPTSIIIKFDEEADDQTDDVLVRKEAINLRQKYKRMIKKTDGLNAQEISHLFDSMNNEIVHIAGSLQAYSNLAFQGCKTFGREPEENEEPKGEFDSLVTATYSHSIEEDDILHRFDANCDVSPPLKLLKSLTDNLAIKIDVRQDNLKSKAFNSKNSKTGSTSKMYGNWYSKSDSWWKTYNEKAKAVKKESFDYKSVLAQTLQNIKTQQYHED